MLNPCIIISNNILILKSTLNINFSFHNFTFLFVFLAKFDHFDAINIIVNPITHKKDLATTSFSDQIELLKVLLIPVALDNGKAQ